MKKTTHALLLLCTVCSLSLNAQIYDWTTFFSGEFSERFACNSSDGSVFMVGSFQGTVSQGDFSITADLGGSTDAYLTKLNEQGDVQWMQRLGGSTGDGGRGIATDNEGNVYVIIDTQDFAITLSNGLTLPHPTYGSYLIKFDSNGTYLWHQIHPGLQSIAIADNSVYCSLFGSQLLRLSQTSGTQLASFVTSGMNMQKIVATTDGRVAATCRIYGNETMPDGSTLYNSGMGIEINIFGQNEPDYGIVCLDTALNFLWSQQLSSSHGEATLATDDEGNIYTSVNISYGATIDDSVLTAPVSPITRKTLIRLDSEGSVSWIRTYDNQTNAPNVAVGTANGVIYCADNYQSLNLSDGSNFYTGSQDVLIIAYNADGSTNYVDFIGRSLYQAKVFSLTKDNAGNIYAGAYTNNTNFYIGCNYYENQQSLAFILKFHEGDRSAPTPAIVNNGGVLTATPTFEGSISWYQQGNSTPVGTGSTFIPTQVGFYSVTYVNEYGCSATSGETIIQQLDSEEPVLSCSTNADLMAGELCTGLAEIVVTATDNSGVASITNSFNDQGASVLAEFPVGSTIITFTATDGFGNASTCDVAVNVMDVDAPTISCPPSVDAETLTNDIELTIGEAVAADNCGAVSVTNSFSASADAAGIYPVGTTTVIYTASDDAGNTSSCEVAVNVTAISAVMELSAASIHVWPNPASNQVTISMNQPWFGQIILRAADGKLIRDWTQAQSENMRISLSLDDIPSGLYFIEVQGSETLRTKLVIE